MQAKQRSIGADRLSGSGTGATISVAPPTITADALPPSRLIGRQSCPNSTVVMAV
ncbi:hypothetical protein [Bradyrhizobium acaciae]|uniref:hypothetical protein n=1 Tax=Bradyrhizobium acaciae TaxID=2683706 RepID=UPI001E4CE95C|nr:hypothetical protein [Bradyrhizobium acaciae]MCC8980929.1 hypothetical protein [Bradyrhizobium acaciae]